MTTILKYEPIDLCFTDLAPRYAWESKQKATRWSQISRLPCFDGVRVLITRILEIAGSRGAECPTITRVEGKITLTWIDGVRAMRVILAPGEPITYFRGGAKGLDSMDPVVLDSEERFFEIFPVLASYVSPPKVYNGFTAD